MSNQLAIDDIEDTRVEMSLPKPPHIRVARYVSNILAPVSVSGPSIVLVALHHASSILAAMFYAGVTLFFLSFGPLIYILIGVRLGKLSDADVSRRAERTGPFLFGIVSITLGLMALMTIHGPKNLETALMSAAVTGIIMMVTTLWWKISMHASSVAGAAIMLTALYGAIMLPAFLLLPLVGWSRVVLGRHTVAQVVVGALVSMALSTLFILLRGVY